MNQTWRAKGSSFTRIEASGAFLFGIIVITLLAAAVRLGPSFQADFPINDGGMFYVMIQDLQRNNFALPALTTYNADSIPYFYPPFGLYFAGLLQSLTGWDLFDLLRILPGLVTTLTVPAFYLLSGVFFERRETRFAATLAFAFFPQSFQWLIAGGGITRSFGMLFSILALWQNLKALQAGDLKKLLPGVLLTVLTIYSHPEAAWFLAYSTLFFFLVKHRNRLSAITLLGLGAGSLALVLPWMAWMIANQGGATVQPLLSGGLLPVQDLLRLVALIDLGTDPFLAVLLALGVLGLIACLIMRKPALPAWALLIYLIQRRAPEQRVVVPFALLAGLAVTEILLPWISARLRGRAAQRTGLLIAAYFALFLPISAYVSSLEYARVLPEPARAAMAWAQENTPADSRFLVFPEDIWIKDRTAEWFPALAVRQSVTTVQGHEWLPGFAERGERHFDLLDCAGQGLACLDAWAQKHAIDYEYIFFSGPVKTYLQGDVEDDPVYRLVYENPAAAIYQKQAQTGVD